MGMFFDWRRLTNERGAIAAFVAVSLVGIIGAGGLAIDLGRGYLRQLRLSRAVDGAVIASASAIRQGVTAAMFRQETGQVPVQVQEMGPRHVALPVQFPALLRIRQGKTAVYDHGVAAGHQFPGLKQRSAGHDHSPRLDKLATKSRRVRRF